MNIIILIRILLTFCCHFIHIAYTDCIQGTYCNQVNTMGISTDLMNKVFVIFK